MLKVNEIFYSIQGESSFAGLPCIFIRLTYCNLRCSYCDTEYAFFRGKDYTVESILTEIKKYNCNLIEVTGGEPLVQNESLELMKTLRDGGYTVLLETGGSLPIKDVDKRVRIIMDLKTPSSGMAKKNDYANFEHLKEGDEIKFVIGDEPDFLWATNVLHKNKLADKFTVLFSPVYGKLEPVKLAEWILSNNLPFSLAGKIRMQIQMHKYIWDPEMRGV